MKEIIKVMKVALYARVSTDNQEIEDQEKQLTEWAEEKGYDYKLYSEEVSSIKERPKFNKMMDSLNQYDVVVVRDLDRFGRSTVDILNKIDRLIDNETGFRCLDQPILDIDPGEEQSPIQEAVTEMMSTFASFERKMIRKRLERGYEKALEQGRVGRPRKLNKEQAAWVWKKYQDGYSFNTLKALVNEKWDKDISIAPIQTIVNEKRKNENE